MKRNPFILSALLTMVLLLSACASPQAATSAPATQAPTLAPAATEALPVTGAGTSVAMSSSSPLGPMLVDDKGMTLYLFEKDTPNTSNCYDKCATNWPPLLTTGNPVAGDGVDASKLGVTQRTDGTTQVTYNGWPLYYYAKDAAAGDTTGQGVGDVWFVIAPDGSEVKGAQAAPPAAGTTVAVSSSGSLGPMLVDDKGMTLYLFEKDTPNTSNCYDKCATNWPPLLTTGSPVAGDGVDASKLGVTQRTDGTSQVTYNGWPLYYYAKDAAAGDTTGQGVGDVWFVIAPDGSEVKGAQAAPPAAATQPAPAY